MWRSYAAVSDIDPPARKHEFAGHELVRFVTFTHQNTRYAGITPDQNQGSCITWTNCAGMWTIDYILHGTRLCASRELHKLLQDR